jgi:hypothetical protein
MMAVTLLATLWTVPDEEKPNLDRFLFLAVLEGLLEEGVSDEAVVKILETDARGAYVNFVYACPICTPVVEAFRVYQRRRDWQFGRKGDPYGMGSGLPGDLAAALGGGDRAKRREAMQKLVGRFVERRMARTVMRPTEKEALKQAIAEGRKMGGDQLPGQAYLEMKECPSCEGAFKAAEGKRSP